MVRLGALFLAIVLLSPLPGLAAFSNTGVPPEGPQSSIRILTLNVMQSSGFLEPRTPRFEDIATYVNSNQPIHALALQELSAGTTLSDPPKTDDSGADLAGMLGGKYGYYTKTSHRYEYDYVLVQPWVEFKVGVLPRYSMGYIDATKLDPLEEDNSIELDSHANVVMCGMDIPGFGLVNLYSTHFYDGTVDELQTQINNLITFIEEVDELHPARATIVAGDLNFNVYSWNKALYDTFINEGFLDSYAEVNDLESDPGYTYGVSDDPFHTSDTPTRIDYIFVRGDDLQITSSQVVFDVDGEYVSDHFGVLTEITATPLPSTLLLLGSSLLGLAGLGYRRRRK